MTYTIDRDDGIIRITKPCPNCAAPLTADPTKSLLWSCTVDEFYQVVNSCNTADATWVCTVCASGVGVCSIHYDELPD